MKTSRTTSRRRRESVRPSIDRSGLPGRDDEWGAQLVEAQVDPFLADRRGPAEAVEVADHLLALTLQGGLLVGQPVDVDGGRRDLHGLGEREEAEHEDDRDRPQQDPHPVGPAARPDGGPGPAAGNGRSGLDPWPGLDGGPGPGQGYRAGGAAQPGSTQAAFFYNDKATTE